MARVLHLEVVLLALGLASTAPYLAPAARAAEVPAEVPAAPSIAPPDAAEAVFVSARATFEDPTLARELGAASTLDPRALAAAARRAALRARLAALEDTARQPARTVEPAPSKAVHAVQVRELEVMFGARAPEVAYALAHALEARGRGREAAALQRHLLERWPSSPWAGPASYALGRFAAAAGDTADAARRFLDVTRAPAPENRLYGLAWYHLLELAEARREGKAAALARAKLDEYAAVYAERADAAVLGEWVAARPTVAAKPVRPPHGARR